jgi:UPF0176 protein
MKIVVCALYHFVSIDQPDEFAAGLRRKLGELRIKGTLLIAHEGINGTIAGSRSSMDSFLGWLKQDARFSTIAVKESVNNEMPFHRTRVKIKQEIVTMGVLDIDPREIVGTYVKPGDWNELISDPEVTLIDTRNEYEVGIGTFEGAVNPHTKTFREFPGYAKSHLDPEKHKKIAMFCTGGIRCEKSTAYLKSQGFSEVYHLEGGILKYLEEVPSEASMWEGECFVFDDRVTVNHDLERGSYDQCHACRMPITDDDKKATTYTPGVSCPHCFDKTSETARARFEEREKQIQLSRDRGEVHIGSDAKLSQARHKREKQQLRATRGNKGSE